MSKSVDVVEKPSESLTFEQYASLNGCTKEEARALFWEYETAFVQDIHAMNTMYALPTPEKPVLPTTKDMENYRDVLVEEIQELDLIIAKLTYFKEPNDITPNELDLVQYYRIQLEPFVKMNEYERFLDVLADLADFNCDIQVYAASENTKWGLPNNAVMHIIMSSNFSKLGADGKPIHDSRGKFLKGPNYWKPEPKIKELLRSIIRKEST